MMCYTKLQTAGVCLLTCHSQVYHVTDVRPATTGRVPLTPNCSVRLVTAVVELRLTRHCATISPASVSTAARERLDHSVRHAPHTLSTTPNVGLVSRVIGASMSTDVVVCIFVNISIYRQRYSLYVTLIVVNEIKRFL